MDARYWFVDRDRPSYLFIYGQVFFVLGLAIFWQSRRHSRLDLARSLVWLGLFGLIHGIHEWGNHLHSNPGDLSEPGLGRCPVDGAGVLLALSYFCLFQFGTVLLSSLAPNLRWTQTVPGVLLLLWMTAFLWESQVSLWMPERLVLYANVWARYMLGFPGALVAALALWQQARLRVQVPGYQRIARNFRGCQHRLAGIRFAGWTAWPSRPILSSRNDQRSDGGRFVGEFRLRC